MKDKIKILDTIKTDDGSRVYVGFSKAAKKNAIVSQAIRFIEKTDFSHVYLLFWSAKMQRCLIYHAAGHTVHFANLERFEKDNTTTDLFEIPLSPDQHKGVMQFCIDNVGVPYGAVQLFGMLLVRLFGALVHDNPFADGSMTQVCSEIVGRVLLDNGYNIDVKQLEIQGPKYLFKTLKEANKK